MKIRLEYKKDDYLIFFSALDIERMWERLLRRSGLKLKFTEGFNPKVIKDFSPAIPLGIISESEIIDFFITENLTLESILEKIRKVLPLDLTIKRVKMVDENSPSLSKTITHIKISIIGKEVRNINLCKINFEKVVNGKLKIVELNKFIFEESIDENGKNLILDSKVSLKDIFNYLKEKSFEFSILKKENFVLRNDKLISIFDLN